MHHVSRRQGKKPLEKLLHQLNPYQTSQRLGRGGNRGILCRVQCRLLYFSVMSAFSGSGPGRT